MSNGLAFAQIRSRPSAFIGTFIALLFGAVVIISSGTLLLAAATASPQPVRYRPAPVVVAADQFVGGQQIPDRVRLGTGLADRLAALPEVSDAVADTVFPATAAAPGRTAVTLDGQPASSAQLLATGDGAAGKVTPRPGQTVLDTRTAKALGVSRGDTVTLTSPAGTGSFEVAGVLAARTPGAWFENAEAGRLSGHPGKADAIAVLPEEGVSTAQLAERVRAAAGSAKVFTGDGRGEVENPGFAPAQENTVGMFGAMGGLSIYVSIFVVANTMSLSISQRRRETALLRGIGARPGHIRRMAAAEATLVAVLAVAAGSAPGHLLARLVFDAMDARHLLPPGTELTFSWLPVAAAALTGLLAAVPGSLIASHRAARSRPAEALSESALPRRGIGPLRLLLGLAALAGGAVVAVQVLALGGATANKAAPFVLLLFLVSVSLLGPLLARAATEVLGVPMRLFGATGELATLNGRARARRLSSAIVPVALVVAFGVTKIGQQTTLTHEKSTQSAAAVTADRVIEAPGGLPGRVADDVARLPGVRAATGVTEVGLLAGPGHPGAKPGDGAVSGSAFSGTGETLARNLDPQVRSGALSGVRAGGTPGSGDGTVAVDQRVADRADTGVGRRITLWLGDGTVVRPVVAATYSRGLGVGEVLLPRATVAGHLTHQLDDRILVRADSGDGGARLDQELRTVAGASPGATVRTDAAFAEARDAADESFTWLEFMALSMIAGFAGITAANTLAMVTFEQLREVSMLRLIGTSVRTVRRTVRLEALTVALTGLAAGLTIALVTLTPLVEDSTGAAFPYLPPQLLLLVAAGTVALSLLATGVPLRLLLRVRPVEGVTRRS
ncbi:ABC transporter permease [Streptomyces decoyicus]|uniref:ABC transporter permease n=1 Tax=Streptomyces decoyicus TaxID=249567 RepID=UPI00381A5D53